MHVYIPTARALGYTPQYALYWDLQIHYLLGHPEEQLYRLDATKATMPKITVITVIPILIPITTQTPIQKPSPSVSSGLQKKHGKEQPSTRRDVSLDALPGTFPACGSYRPTGRTLGWGLSCRSQVWVSIQSYVFIYAINFC